LKMDLWLPLLQVGIDDKLMADIKQNGIQEPVEIRIREDGTKIVWDGLHRLAIAVQLDIKSIPVFYTR
ncbi:hypothetical protein LCGC14_2688330, partial [marine sediment metagenome]